MRKCVLAYVAAVSLVSTAGVTRAGSLWEPLGGGANNTIARLIAWDGTLYALGWFTEAGGQPAIGAAAWDGSQWTPLGIGLNLGGHPRITIHNDLLTMDDALVDLSLNGMLTWDGTAWAQIASAPFDPDGSGDALESFQGRLYVGDSFYSLTTGSYWGRLWSLGGSGWVHEEWFSAGVSYGGINLVTVLDNKLYVLVYSPSAPLYVYNGTSWSLHSTTYLEHGRKLVVFNGDLYLGGLTAIGDSYVIRWDGAAWTAVLAEHRDPPCPCYQGFGDMVEHDSNLIVSGYVDHATGVTSWDGSSWARLSGEMAGGSIRALAVYDGSLIAAGSFTEVDGIPMSHIARYTGTVTPVAITSFTAHVQSASVQLDWEIAADEGFDGFHIYRSAGREPDARVNARLIPAAERSFVDTGVVPGGAYSYLLVAVGAATGEYHSQRISVQVPSVVASLEQNVPNPFNPSTTIGFSVAEAGDIRIDVFDATGAWVCTLVDRAYGPGEWTVSWDGTGAGGEAVASGVYYYRMRVGNESYSKKMVLLK